MQEIGFQIVVNLRRHNGGKDQLLCLPRLPLVLIRPENAFVSVLVHWSTGSPGTDACVLHMCMAMLVYMCCVLIVASPGHCYICMLDLSRALSELYWLFVS